jgi:DNA-binding NarL/FixJ family response regulator
MSRLTGLEAASVIKEQHPETTILMVSSHSESEYKDEARRRGASGYVVKGAELNSLG